MPTSPRGSPHRIPCSQLIDAYYTCETPGARVWGLEKKQGRSNCMHIPHLIYHTLPGKHPRPLKHNSRFLAAWALTWDINYIHLYRSCYIDPMKWSTWVLARDTSHNYGPSRDGNVKKYTNKIVGITCHVYYTSLPLLFSIIPSLLSTSAYACTLVPLIQYVSTDLDSMYVGETRYGYISGPSLLVSTNSMITIL